MASKPPTTTVLRVKRPRHVESVSRLCVDLGASRQRKRHRNDEALISQGLEQLMHHSSYVSAQQQRHVNNRVTWKRMDDAVDSKCKVRYVDARLDDDTRHEEEDMPKTKRRRLALTLLQDSQEHEEPSKPTPSPKKKNIILDPLSRLVDESLKQVFTGGVTVSQHLDFITGDPRLATDSAFSKSHDWLAWCTQTGGTVLHAAVLLNDIKNVKRILQLSMASSRRVLIAALDEDGRTPQDVATMTGHDSIAELLDTQSITENADEDFVYDMFCIQDDEDRGNDSNYEVGEETDAMSDTTPVVELRGGIGYWNEEGELVLETLPDNYDLGDEDDNDEDDDSNCEDYEGNDYPDEHAWHDDEDSDVEENHDFRNRPVDLSKVGALNIPMYNAHDSDDDFYQDIDAHYDHYDSSPKPERLYAYDFELDDDAENGFNHD